MVPASPSRRPVLAVPALLAAVLSALLLTAGPASAHASLVRVVPGDGSTVTTAPTQVRLVFDDTIREPAAVVVTGPSGRVGRGPAVVDGSTVVAPVAVQQAGRYTVAYRVVSDDGHPVSGESTFTYQPADDGAATPLSTGSTSQSASPSASPSAGPSADATRPASSATPDSDGGVNPWVVTGLVAVLLAVAALLLVPRRRR